MMAGFGRWSGHVKKLPVKDSVKEVSLLSLLFEGVANLCGMPGRGFWVQAGAVVNFNRQAGTWKGVCFRNYPTSTTLHQPTPNASTSTLVLGLKNENEKVRAKHKRRKRSTRAASPHEG